MEEGEGREGGVVSGREERAETISMNEERVEAAKEGENSEGLDFVKDGLEERLVIFPGLASSDIASSATISSGRCCEVLVDVIVYEAVVRDIGSGRRGVETNSVP
mmetsp:Transcript_28231/g.59379  ORF Transcript_28231/g.59379 Transcript_28231/m.59379 type:complete len:105 (-) Transcript_28231:153-467(-)